jgi:hypothetical protein
VKAAVFFVAEFSDLGSWSGVITGLPLAERADAPALRILGVREEERRGVSAPFLSSNHLHPHSQQKTDGEGTWLKRTRTAGESGRSRPRVLCGAALTRGADVRQPAVDGLFLRDSRLRVHQRNSRSGWCSCNTTHSRCMWATHLCVAKGLSRGWASRVAERAGRRGVPRRPSNL